MISCLGIGVTAVSYLRWFDCRSRLSCRWHIRSTTRRWASSHPRVSFSTVPPAQVGGCVYPLMWRHRWVVVSTLLCDGTGGWLCLPSYVMAQVGGCVYPLMWRHRWVVVSTLLCDGTGGWLCLPSYVTAQVGGCVYPLMWRHRWVVVSTLLCDGTGGWLCLPSYMTLSTTCTEWLFCSFLTKFIMPQHRFCRCM